jgi:hypothetical protein
LTKIEIKRYSRIEYKKDRDNGTIGKAKKYGKRKNRIS